MSESLNKSQLRQYAYYALLDHFIGRKKGKSLTIKSRKKFYDNLFNDLKRNGEQQLIPIDRRKDLSDAEFKEKYLKRGIPVVFEGAAKEWDCVKKWSFDYFKSLHGTDEIVMADQYKIENPYEKLTLGKLIDEINQGSGKYYRFYPLLKRHPEHLLDFDYEWLRSKKNRFSFLEAFQVFMGGDKTITPMHSANLPNLFTQVVGEKKWVLYHPNDTAIIDPDPVKGIYRSAPFKKKEGPFNPFNPDYSPPYSLFNYIRGYSVHLKPGDVLWNPPYYWHAVENVGMSIGVGYRWCAPLYCYQLAPLYAFLDTMVVNPPIWKSLKFVQKDANLIHLLEGGMLKEYLANQKT